MKRPRWLPRAAWLPLLFLLVLQLLPLVTLLLTSFKSRSSLLRLGPVTFAGFCLGNYREVWADGFGGHLVTSTIVALGSTAISVAAGGSLAYALARWSFRGHGLLRASILGSRMLPTVALAVPVVLLLRHVHLDDSVAGLMLAHTTFNLPFAGWLLLPFFAALPKELEEAATMDGCTRFAAFWRIILPVSLPGLMITAVFCFLASWNDFLFSLVVAGSGVKTAALAVNGYMTGFGPEWGPMTAASMLILLPAMVLSMALQRHVVEGFTAGGVKDG